ncbi:hypothetical protein [Campylobacter novaezeelandiae]|uniref:hypothetical protein n=1 Tax=Campylobacter novaezeelandiae TaxID=2267891 RepID=UPI001FB6E8C7|nr:hypothetical protein [Campylobacter novaezeelandiae]
MPRKNLIENKNQHKAKNLHSKKDDLNIDLAMQKTKKYLEKRFSSNGYGGGLQIL